MIIEFKIPHALNMGEDFEYLSTFILKDEDYPKLTLQNCRILVKGVKTGKEYFMMLEDRENFFGRPIQYFIGMIEVTDWVTDDQARGEKRGYNYYRVGYDIRDVHTILTSWRQVDPLVHMGNLTHQFVSKAGQNYKGAYKFDNKIY